MLNTATASANTPQIADLFISASLNVLITPEGNGSLCRVGNCLAQPPHSIALLARLTRGVVRLNLVPSLLDLVLELVSLVCGDCQPVQRRGSSIIMDSRRRRRGRPDERPLVARYLTETFLVVLYSALTSPADSALL